MQDADSLTPFPTLMDEPAEPWRWPKVPYEWRHVPVAVGEEPCAIETVSGTVVEGLFAGMNPLAATVQYRSRAEGTVLSLPFFRFRKLSLKSPLRGDVPLGGGIAERVPIGAQQRDFHLAMPGGHTMSGRTAGHVEAAEGLYLFIAVDDDRALQRVFVPRGAYTHCEFGSTVQDRAAEKWIGTRSALLAAIDHQRAMPVRPIGQALLDLGLVTPEQLERALGLPDSGKPLGERLVAMGVLSRSDLDTAIAHKMGYPLVDLTRYPIEPQAARKLPLRLAVKHRALPIGIEGDRMIVAVDKPSRAQELQSVYAVASYRLVAVLASKAQILLALQGLAQTDVWSDRADLRAGIFATSL